MVIAPNVHPQITISQGNQPMAVIPGGQVTVVWNELVGGNPTTRL